MPQPVPGQVPLLQSIPCNSLQLSTEETRTKLQNTLCLIVVTSKALWLSTASMARLHPLPCLTQAEPVCFVSSNMKHLPVISICFQEDKQKQSLMPFVTAVLWLYSLLILVFYFSKLDKIKGACNASSLPIALIPAGAAPPAQLHKIEREMKSPPSNVSTPKGICWIENKEGMQQKPH